MDNFLEKNIEIDEYFKEYLKFRGFNNTFTCFKAEVRANEVNENLDKNVQKMQMSKYEPKIYSMMGGIEKKNNQ